MKYLSDDFHTKEKSGGAGAAFIAGEGGATQRQPASRNWAWAHRSESYDWMDRAGSFQLEEMYD